MKKLVSGLLAATCIATMSVGVMAADISVVKGTNYEWALNNGAYSVQVDGLTKGNRYGLLAIAADATLDEISPDNTDIIMYIDQATATGESGTITFNGSGNGFLPKDPLELDAAGYKLYIGGYEDGSATQIGVLAAPKTVHATSVTLNKSTLSLTVDAKETLTATIVPADAVETTVTWSSDAPTIASVNETTGEVTAIAEGTANITATVVGTQITATCAVTVTDGIPGDVDGSGAVDSDDAIYLLWNTIMGDTDYPIKDGRNGDVDSSGAVDSDDAIYLLWNTIMGDTDYPLYPSNN